MDTTKQNILMNEKAYELHREILGFGNYWVSKKTGEIHLIKHKGKTLCHGHICLYTQDQLQGMVDLDIFELCKRFDYFLSKLYQKGCNPIQLFTSMVQLWLAFVMWILYKKKWNGETWILN